MVARLLRLPHCLKANLFSERFLLFFAMLALFGLWYLC